jgi:hypothetical protein
MRFDKIEKRIIKLEGANRKECCTIQQGNEESHVQALERHFREHPEDKNAKLKVLIRNFNYEIKYGFPPQVQGVVTLPT